jgi:multicomponent K+:H+ antiporter subunit A
MRFVHDVFFNGEPRGLPKMPHEAPFFMRLPVLLLVVLCVVVGLLPAQTAGPLLAVAAQAALHGGPGPALPAYTLALWHGLNLPLLMSMVATGGGVLLYFGLRRFIDLHALVHLPLWLRTGGRDVFMALMRAGVAAAQGLTRALETGSLQRYLSLLLLLALLAGAWPFVGSAPLAQMAAPHLHDLSPGVALVGAIGIAAALGTVAVYRQRVLALVLMGAAGLVVCLVFVWFSAPDLALTQLLVEVATIVLMMLALRWLPAASPPEPARWRAGRDALIAIAVGLGVTAIVWMVLTRPFDSISPFFLAQSLPLGGGANVVNVIIVDFRAFDTLGEITVLGIAGLIMHALLAGFAPPRHALPADESHSHPLMLQLVSRLVLPFAVLLSIYFYLRGHNLPGGGFIAGLVLAIPLLLQHVAHGGPWVEARTGRAQGGDFRGWVAGGLLVAAGTGIASAWFGAPFLTSTYDYPWLPGVGGVPLASAAAFDLGVYLVVVGGTMVMLLSIARLSRKPL